MKKRGESSISRRQALQTGSLSLAAATAVVLARSGSAAAATGTVPFLVVDPAGGGDFTDLPTAVSSAPPGAMLFVRRGTYTISAGGLQPADGVTITGEGYGTHIVAAAGLVGNLFDLTSDHVVLERVRIDGNAGNRTAGSGNCISIEANNIRVVDCWIHDAAGSNIIAWNYLTNILIRGNHLYGTSPSRAYPATGIQLNGAQNSSVVNNTIWGAGQSGIYLLNGGGDCHHNAVTGNTISQCGTAIAIDDAAHDNAITGNACSASGWGIWVHAGSSGGPSKGLTISGNAVANCSNNGIQLDSSTESVVADNVSHDNGLNGIVGYGVRGCVLSANRTSRNQQAGIVLDDSNDNVCEGNVSTDNGQNASLGAMRAGIALLQHSTTCANNVISNNRCFDTQASPTQQYGVSVLNSTNNNVLVGNILDGNASPGRALYVSNAAATYPVPYRRLTVTVGTSRVAIPHGLPYAPLSTQITMTSAGVIWRSASADRTSIYLTADAANRTAEVLVG